MLDFLLTINAATQKEKTQVWKKDPQNTGQNMDYRVGKIMTLVGLRDVLMLLAEVLQVVGRVEKRIEEEKKQDLRRRLNK